MVKDQQSFCIGTKADTNNYVSVYAHGLEVHYGDKEYQQNFLNYVKEQRPDKQWEIFYLITANTNE